MEHYASILGYKQSFLCVTGWYLRDGAKACVLQPRDAVSLMGESSDFEGQIVQDGLKEHMISEYLFYDGAHEDENTWVDITEFVEKRVNAGSKYVSQFGPGWSRYKPKLSEAELKQMKESTRSAMPLG
jgi:hypothetical protein